MSNPEDDHEFLYFYMKETWSEMRHTEQLRATVSSLIIALATLIAGFIVQQGFGQGTSILSVIMIGLGLFGAIMTRKLYQLHQFGQERLDNWYIYIQKKMPDSEVLERRDEADRSTRKQFPFMSAIPHNVFWFIMNLFISATGVVMLIITLTKP